MDQHDQNDIFERLGRIETRLDGHMAEEDRVLARIDASLNSLLITRSFTRGFVKAMLLVSAALSTVVTLIVMYFHK